MDALLLDWLNVGLRWTHLIAGIGWIGTSLYFMWLDAALIRADPHGAPPGSPPRGDVEGHTWLLHSGGFYLVERRTLPPGQLPSPIHWFKWEAAMTWLTGFPLLVMWFGIGAVPAVLTAFLLAFFPIAVNVAVGMATLESELRDVLRVLGASRGQVFRKVGVPRTMPLFFASLKVAISSAFVGSVISETVASNAGIGYLMAVAASDFNTRLAFGGLFVLAALGVLLYGVFAVIERRMTGWAYTE